MPEQACDILVLTSYAALEGAAAPFVEEYGARYQVKMTPYQSLYRSDEAITASVDPSAKVIITRGYPATACRRLTDKHVVELSISFQDVLSALDRVLRPDTVRAAVIVYDNMLSGERSMVRLGGLELYFLTLTQFTRNRDKELIVDFLRRNRIQAAVGSALAGEAAGQCGVPFGIIASGERSIARAFEEAAALLERDRAAALRKHAELRSNLNRGWVTRYTFNDILCVSAATEEVKRQARRFAASSRNVLITGETGTGKELFAQSIHSASPRMDRPFISINCGELSESLLESELFGYEKGAYTGASKAGSAGPGCWSCPSPPTPRAWSGSSTGRCCPQASAGTGRPCARPTASAAPPSGASSPRKSRISNLQRNCALFRRDGSNPNHHAFLLSVLFQICNTPRPGSLSIPLIAAKPAGNLPVSGGFCRLYALFCSWHRPCFLSGLSIHSQTQRGDYGTDYS